MRTKQIGFLRDKRRLNVALTRAKYGLILLGDKNLLYRDKKWKQLIQTLNEDG